MRNIVITDNVTGFYRYGPPVRTPYRVVVENLSSRVSWQVYSVLLLIAVKSECVLKMWIFSLCA